MLIHLQACCADQKAPIDNFYHLALKLIGDLSHTKVVISNKAKLRRIYKIEVWDKSHIPLLVVG